MFILKLLYKISVVVTVTLVALFAVLLLLGAGGLVDLTSSIYRINTFRAVMCLFMFSCVSAIPLLLVMVQSIAQRSGSRSTRKTLDTFRLIKETGDVLTTALDKGKLLRMIIDAFCSLFESEYGFLLVMDLKNNEYVYEAGHGMNKTLFENTKFEPESQIYGKLFNVGKTVTFHDVKGQAADRFSFLIQREKLERLDYPEQLASIPLKIEERILAVVNIYTTKAKVEFFQENEMPLALFINQAAVAVGSAIQSEFAILDRLTMMYNHEYFQIRFREELERCRRYQTKLSLLMFDIDHFKKFNDTYGHQVGDEVLKIISQVLKSLLRMTDFSARYGGEEFVVMLPETSLKNAIEAAERIRKTVEEYPFKVEGQPVQINVSIGVTSWTSKDDMNMTTDVMIKQADEQLYKAKEGGRNCVCHREPDHPE